MYITVYYDRMGKLFRRIWLYSIHMSFILFFLMLLCLMNSENVIMGNNSKVFNFLNRSSFSVLSLSLPLPIKWTCMHAHSPPQPFSHLKRKPMIVYLQQLCSSLPSTQSGKPSQNQARVMHVPSAHGLFALLHSGIEIMYMLWQRKWISNCWSKDRLCKNSSYEVFHNFNL